MSKHFRIIVLFSVFVSFSLCVTAQHITRSPYSRYGIGDLVRHNLGQSQAMGGISAGLRSPNHLNMANPASYSKLNQLSFIFDVGLSYTGLQLKTKDAESFQHNGNLAYLTMGFPITKWWFASAGIIPYSTIGYQIHTKDSSFINFNRVIDNTYVGSGGLNQCYIGQSFKVYKDLSIGVNASYLFGSLNRNSTTQIPSLLNSDISVIEYETKNIVRDWYFDFGAQYTHTFAENYPLTLGVVFENNTKLNATRTSATYNILQIDNNTFYDTLFLEPDVEDYIELPKNLGVGFTFGKEGVWTVGADFYQQDWTKATFFGAADNNLAKSNKIAIGGEYLPQMGSPSYFKNVRYRLGAHYANSYLSIPISENDLGQVTQREQLKDYSISIGLGLPMRGAATTFNFALEVGRRGTTNNNLIQENYIIGTFNISLYDIWFVKRKYD